MRVARERHKGPNGLAHNRRGHWGAELVVAVAALLTWLACYNRETLTSLEQEFGPADDGPRFASYQYGDQDNNGTSTVSVIEGESLAWLCDLQKTYKYGYCGFGVVFDQYHTGRGLDLSRYDRVNLTLNYQGSSQSLRLAIKDKNPRYAELGAPNDEKVNQASIAVSPGQQTVALDLDQFAVVEWWKEAASKPSVILSQPRFDNVTAIELLTAIDSEAGQQSLRIERIGFSGQMMSIETWYGGIAIAWLLLIGSIMLQRRRDAQQWRRRLAELMRATVDSIPHMVWSLDQEGRTSFNKRWEEFTGIPFDNVDRPALLRLVHPDDVREAARRWNEGLRSGSEFSIELRLRHHSGEHRWVLARAVPSHTTDVAVAGWYGTCTDAHDRVIAQQALSASVKKERKRSQQLKWSSEHDSLTRLPNRRAFEARLDQIILGPETSGAQLGLLLIDMDYFKHTNDTLGHSAGDELLKAIATRLKRSVRSQDFVARIGGDEFAVILSDLNSKEDLTAICKKVVSAIQQTLNLDDHAIRPSASIGGAICQQSKAETGDFLKMADAALYALKRSGRGGFRLFEPYMLDDVKQAAFQLACARDAIVDGSITAVYQPKVALSDDTIVGFEALLRLKSPGGILGLPQMLAEAFNDYELAAKIGEAMQMRVARDVKQWIDAGIDFGRVSINAAPAEFLRDDYAERLLGILERFGVPPSCIEIEVTEYAFIELGWEYVARALDQLKSAGVEISLDDFGTGHSSLSHIRDFPVGLIKIDQSYTRLITEDGAIASLVSGLVHLACSLGLKVVAEGVETTRQLELLREMGCHYVQGHLLGYPVEGAQVRECLAGKARLEPALVASSRVA
ncbi:putative bifunctional diguanylate cyclase/phosphodiesterase [Altererythrobacter sp.]|uniref:putative bifunctional diguanylate cyclase/phosphodiesterase n=1 Tax=Altererythrobacter sp. TaxID=1872480 RepID=UPI003D0154C3